MGCGATASAGQRYSPADSDKRAAAPQSQSAVSSTARPAGEVQEQSRQSRSGAVPQQAQQQQRTETSGRSQNTTAVPHGSLPHARAERGGSLLEARTSGTGKLLQVPASVPVLDLRELERLEVVDETPMSTVFRLRDRRNGTFLAGKRIRKGCKTHATGDYLNEVRMLQRLSQASGVLAFHGICDDGGPDFWTVSEFCAGGRLEVWLQQCPDSAQRVARQLVEVVQMLHGLKICHLDIKPDNVLLTKTGEVRLCDFVTACELEAAGQQLLGNCGTEGFKAPEVTSGRGYNGMTADIFSLGRTLQVLARSAPAWTELIKTSRQMTQEEPCKRPSIKTVHGSLFSAAHVQPAFDFASLDTVSSHEASRTMDVKGNSQGAPSVQRSANLAQPPEIRSRWNTANRSASMDSASNHSERYVNSVNAPNFAEVPRKANAQSYTLTSGLKMPEKPTIRSAPKCGSVLCSRLGCCLCDDKPSSSVGAMRPQDRPGAKALRRSNS